MQGCREPAPFCILCLDPCHWLFVSWTAPFECDTFQPLEYLIRQVFIPALTSCPPPNDNSQLLFTLPAHRVYLSPQVVSLVSWLLPVTSLSHLVRVLLTLLHPNISLRKSKHDNYSKQIFAVTPTVGFVLTVCTELGYCWGCFKMADYFTFE